MLTRMQIINTLIKKKGYKNYLEIGVQTGKCLFKIDAPHKIAVDPEFKLENWRKWFSFANNRNTQYFELTSDDFFNQHGHRLEKMGGIDIAFIDGLHIYEQTNRDVENCLKYLNKNGIILMHDCNPPTADAETRAWTYEEFREKTDNRGYLWCGDVWKTLAYYKATRRDLEVCCFDTDFGIGAIYYKDSEPNNIDKNQILSMGFKELRNNCGEIINLKNAKYFEIFITNF